MSCLATRVRISTSHNTSWLEVDKISSDEQACTPALFKEYVFDMKLSDFVHKRLTRDPPCFNWESDNCTWAFDTPFGFPFTYPCQRHDFGVRNYVNVRQFSTCRKIAMVFYHDMEHICNNPIYGKSNLKKWFCHATMWTYYQCARMFTCNP